jgi:hypothetical protein
MICEMSHWLKFKSFLMLLKGFDVPKHVNA